MPRRAAARSCSPSQLGGWKATLNGRALTALAEPFDGWAQAFTLPAGGG